MAMRAAAAVLTLAIAAAVTADGTARGASPARACIRESCRPPGRDCAAAFRDAKGPALAACTTPKRKNDPCRKAVRRFVRDGIRACRDGVVACADCCRTAGDACSVAVCGNAHVETGEACD